MNDQHLHSGVEWSGETRTIDDVTKGFNLILELMATPEEVMRAVHALWEFGERKQVPEKVLFGLALALEESGSNIVNHALRREPGRRFQVGFHYTETALVVELRDSGPEFNPTEVREVGPPDDGDRAPGGWGISLIRRHIDQISYTREGDENVLRLTKSLGQASQT